MLIKANQHNFINSNKKGIQMVKVNRLAYFFIRKLGLGLFLLRIHPSSALKNYGWFRSFRSWKSIDKSGDIIPWWTYSFNDFIKDRLTCDMRVLEFGCGSSSICLSRIVKEVVSIENNQAWFDNISTKLPKNAKVLFTDCMDKFVPEEKELGRFDVLIIDALGLRIEHAKNSIHLLNDKGIIIWDNTNNNIWDKINPIMQGFGFKEISFSGMTAQEFALSRTTVFYRQNNCLNI